MKKELKTLNDFNFKNKKIILRTDLNSELKNKKLIKSERIKQAAGTIKELKKKKARIIILAHQGTPGKEDFISLKQHSEQLSKYTKVKFVPEIVGKKAVIEIKNLKEGSAILLENIRKEKDEFKPNKKNNILKKLADLADIYINDAFSVSHRDHFSITGFPKYLESGIGRITERELEAVKKIPKNLLCILGGAKPLSNIKLIGKKILSCGIFGQMCNIAKGYKLGKENNEVNKKIAKDYRKGLKKLKKINMKKVKTPKDFAVEITGKRKELELSKFPTKYIIYDIGEKTLEDYKKEIIEAKAVYMKGPAGYCEKEKFCKGTLKILKTIGKSKCYSVIGGGHLSNIIERKKIDKSKFNHVSLSGGALLNLIAGEKLPGIKALKQ